MPEDEQKGTDDKFLAATFHHENGDHGIEHCDDQEEESLEIEVRLVWHLDGWRERLVVEGLSVVWRVESLVDVSIRG